MVHFVTFILSLHALVLGCANTDEPSLSKNEKVSDTPQNNSVLNDSSAAKNQSQPKRGWAKVRGRWIEAPYVPLGEHVLIEPDVSVPRTAFRFDAPPKEQKNGEKLENPPERENTQHSDEPNNLEATEGSEKENSLGLIAPQWDGAIDDFYLWPDMRVPYKYGDSTTSSNTEFKTKFEKAVAEFNDKTPILWEPASSTDTNWVNVYINEEPPSCGVASIGYYDRINNQVVNYLKMNPVNCNRDPGYVDFILHEMGHNIGLEHEFKDPDFFNYVIVNKDNLSLSKFINNPNFPFKTFDEVYNFIFAPVNLNDFIVFQSYDYYSIMGYPLYQFAPGYAKDPHQPIIMRKQGSDLASKTYNLNLGLVGISEGNRLGFAKLYEAKGAPIISDIPGLNLATGEVHNRPFVISMKGSTSSFTCANNVRVEPVDTTLLEVAVSDTAFGQGNCNLRVTAKTKVGYADVVIKLLKYPDRQKPQASSDVFTVKIGQPANSPSRIELATQFFPATRRQSNPQLPDLLISQINVTDADPGDTHHLRITGGADAGQFTIINNNLLSNFLLSEKDKYDIQITATDRAGLTKTVPVSICVQNSTCTAQQPEGPSTQNTTNTAPNIEGIAAQSTNEDTAKSGIAVRITDAEISLSCSNLTVTSSNVSIVAAAGIAIAGTAPNCTLALTPAANANGNTTISLSISDGALSASKTFVFTVNAINDAPTIADIAPQSTNEDTAKTGIAVTIGDVDSNVSCSNLTASSSNNAVLLNAGVTSGGTAPNCTLSLTPVANANGNSTISVSLSDGSLSVTKSFVFSVNAVNDAPMIGDVAAQATNEDTAKTGIAVSISDAETNLSCSNLTASSANTNVVAAAGITVGGTAPNCTLSLTPVANASGNSTISLSLTDGALSATKTFVFTVNAVNDPPILSDISAQSTNEDTSKTGIALTISDIDSSLSCSSLTASSSNTAVITNAGITFAGTAPSCTISLTPVANANGNSTITVSMSDGLASATKTFVLAVNAVNDPPTLSDLSAQSTNEDTAKTGIAVTISDVDTNLSCSNLTASSSNTALVAAAGIAIAGTAPSCTLSLTPVANASGNSTISLNVSDGAATTTKSFVFSVNAVNDAPTIGDVATQSTIEDTAKTGIAVTIGDVDSNLSCSTLTASSSNTALVAAAGIAIAGTAPSCTLSLTPFANANGNSTITLNVSDGTATTTKSFVFSVNAVNDAPTIGDVATQSTIEDTAKTGIAVTIGDVDSNLSCSTLTGSSSNTALVAAAGIAIAGTAPSCSLSLTPVANANGNSTITLNVSDGTATTTKSFVFSVNAVNDAPIIEEIENQATDEDNPKSDILVKMSDIDSNLNCLNLSATSSATNLVAATGINISGQAPNCILKLTPIANANGNTIITLNLSDSSLTTTRTFEFNIRAVNDAPQIEAVANQKTNEDTTAADILIKMSDIDSNLNCNNLRAESSDKNIVDTAGIGIVDENPNCKISLKPVANASGNTTITLTVSDSTLSSTSTFILTVNPVNDPPMMSNIANQTTVEDTTLSEISFSINDVDHDLGCNGIVVASSNEKVIANKGVIIGGTTPKCTIMLTPNANASGNSTISLTLSDGSLTATKEFDFRVSEVNDRPTLSEIMTQAGIAGIKSTPIPFSISDIDDSITCESGVSATSNQQDLVSDAEIEITGAENLCQLRLTPKKVGEVEITLSANDGTMETLRTFKFIIQKSMPTAVIKTSSIKGKAPIWIQFSGSESSSKDAEITSWDWDFGDETTGYAKNFLKSYTVPGIYNINLRVKDGKGAIGVNSLQLVID